MKEQILHLDPHDDFNSAHDKMGWAQITNIAENPQPADNL